MRPKWEADFGSAIALQFDKCTAFFNTISLLQIAIITSKNYEIKGKQKRILETLKLSYILLIQIKNLIDYKENHTLARGKILFFRG